MYSHVSSVSSTCVSASITHGLSIRFLRFALSTSTSPTSAPSKGQLRSGLPVSERLGPSAQMLPLPLDASYRKSLIGSIRQAYLCERAPRSQSTTQSWIFQVTGWEG